jgi:NADH:ubiquinone oxidoreductase subunit E
MEAEELNEILFQKISLNDKEEIKSILKSYDKENVNVISILQEIQEVYRYIPPHFIFYLSKKLKIPPAEIYSVATFYTQFRFKDIGKHHIVCCDGTACHVKGIRPMISFLEKYLGISPGEVTKDKIFSLEAVACLGCCAISPVCIINGKIHGNLTTNKLRLLLKRLSKEE